MPWISRSAGLLSACVVAGIAGAAQAAEGGATIYLLGSGGPGAAVLPPIEGVFFDNTIYTYRGSLGAGKALPLGGQIVADIDGEIIADFATVLWTPTTDFAGGVLGVGLALPVGQVSVDARATLTGPLGGQVGAGAFDKALTVGDPIVTAMLGWTSGKWHLQASTMVNVPIGDYREDELANLAFHRWAGDLSLAITWLDEKAGWDVSAKTGFTFNGENEHTDYKSGTDWHLEASVEKKFGPQWSLGVQSYYYKQISGDSGAGATLGAFKGEVTGVGLTGAHNFRLGSRPATLRLRAMTEFDAVNRMEGDSIFIDFTIPLSMKLPGGAR